MHKLIKYLNSQVLHETHLVSIWFTRVSHSVLKRNLLWSRCGIEEKKVINFAVVTVIEVMVQIRTRKKNNLYSVTNLIQLISVAIIDY